MGSSLKLNRNNWALVLFFTCSSSRLVFARKLTSAGCKLLPCGAKNYKLHVKSFHPVTCNCKL
jgi:hypothetical protein